MTTAPKNYQASLALSPEGIIQAFQKMTGDVVREALIGSSAHKNGPKWNRAFGWTGKLCPPEHLKYAFKELRRGQKRQVLNALGYDSAEKFFAVVENLHFVEHLSEGLKHLNRGTSGDTVSAFRTAAAAFDNLSKPRAFPFHKWFKYPITLDVNGSLYAGPSGLQRLAGSLTPGEAWEKGKSLYEEHAFNILRDTVRKRLEVCDFRGAHQRAADPQSGMDALISIERVGPTPDAKVDGQGPRLTGKPQLVQRYDDLNEDDLRYFDMDNASFGPHLSHAARALAFAEEHFTANDSGKLVVHCRVGKARSTATMLGIIAQIYGPGREKEAVEDLMSIRPVSGPNLLLVKHMDAILGRNGALVKAVTSHPIIAGRLYERAVNMEGYWEKFPERFPHGAKKAPRPAAQVQADPVLVAAVPA